MSILPKLAERWFSGPYEIANVNMLAKMAVRAILGRLTYERAIRAAHFRLAFQTNPPVARHEERGRIITIGFHPVMKRSSPLSRVTPTSQKFVQVVDLQDQITQ